MHVFFSAQSKKLHGCIVQIVSEKSLDVSTNLKYIAKVNTTCISLSAYALNYDEEAGPNLNINLLWSI